MRGVLEGVLEGVWIVILIILAIAIIFFLVGGLVSVVELPICNGLDAQSTLDYTWTFWTGCIVNVEGVAIRYYNVNYEVLSGEVRADK